MQQRFRGKPALRLRAIPVYIQRLPSIRAGKTVVIEMIKLNGQAIRVSSVTRKSPSPPRVLQIVFLISGQSVNRDIDHILKETRLQLDLMLDDGTVESLPVRVLADDMRELGTAPMVRYRHAITVCEISPGEEEDPAIVVEAFLAVEASVRQMRRVLESAGVLSRDVSP